MKFTKFGKALLLSALSVGVVLSVTSCVESYAVGYLYVTGTVTSQSSGAGIISGFSIDHNTGKLTPINGLPISSGGANPERAVLLTGSRFLYVLNRGVNAAGGSNCTTAAPCQNANVTLFAVGGNGILSPQATFYTQGVNPFRMVADSSGNFLYILDHDAIDSNAYTGKSLTVNSCTEELGSATTSCGDITTFKVDSTTGRLTLVINSAVTAASGTALTYFPVPAQPVDFLMASGNILTLSNAKTAQTAYPYVGGSSVFPYTYNATSGQLSVSQNTAQPLGILAGTGMSYAGGYLYVLDNEAGSTWGTAGYFSQILPFSVNNGTLVSQTGGVVPDDVTLSNPIALIIESKSKWAYVANQGNLTNTSDAGSGLTGYVLDPSTRQLTTLPGEPFGSGSGPQCIVEDPSDQFIYEANFVDSTVTGRLIDQNSGTLNALSAGSSFALTGPATYCLVNGRTD